MTLRIEMSGRTFDLGFLESPDTVTLTGLEAMTLQRVLGRPLTDVGRLFAEGLERREFSGDLLPSMLFLFWLANHHGPDGDRRTDFETFADALELGTIRIVPDQPAAPAQPDPAATPAALSLRVEG